jgi:hypothetical protein
MPGLAATDDFGVTGFFGEKDIDAALEALDDILLSESEENELLLNVTERSEPKAEIRSVIQSRDCNRDAPVPRKCVPITVCPDYGVPITVLGLYSDEDEDTPLQNCVEHREMKSETRACKDYTG